jgi:hypothetical protein
LADPVRTGRGFGALKLDRFVSCRIVVPSREARNASRLPSGFWPTGFAAETNAIH